MGMVSDLSLIHIFDGEAGIEQISRRVMEQVSHLVLVTDQSAKGVNVCRDIKEAADDLITYERIGMIVNRVVDPSMNDLVRLDGVEVLAYIPVSYTHLDVYKRQARRGVPF